MEVPAAQSHGMMLAEKIFNLGIVLPCLPAGDGDSPSVLGSKREHQPGYRKPKKILVTRLFICRVNSEFKKEFKKGVKKCVLKKEANQH